MAFEPTYHLARGILKPTLWSWFRWSVEGIGNIPSNGPALVCFNHIAYMDPFAAAWTINEAKRRPRFLAKSELFQDKRIAWILRGAGQIEVKRGSRDAPMALDHALKALDRGEVIVIFPEGTITTDPDLEPMAAKSGLGRLAIASGAPVIPGAIWGTANVWPKGYAKRWWPRQDILVRLGEARSYSGDDTPEEWHRIGADVMGEIGTLLASLRPAVPDRRRPKKKAA